MSLKFFVKIVFRHSPRFFGKLFDERVLRDCFGGDDFDEAEFALVIKIEGTAISKFNDNASLLIGKISGKIIARVTGGIAFLAIINQLSSHAKMNHEGLIIV